jgi:hypothetical protein
MGYTRGQYLSKPSRCRWQLWNYLNYYRAGDKRMTNQEATELIKNAGFEGGWTLIEDVLIQWEHNQDPPAPLTRPKATDETPTAD